jgi:hypothetical protein
MSFHRVDVTLKNGFKYSYTCIGKMLSGMKKSSEGTWTESIVSKEITKEEHEASWGVFKAEPRKPERKPEKVIPMTDPPKKNPVAKKSNPKFSSLENFFDGDEPAPKNKKPRKRV